MLWDFGSPNPELVYAIGNWPTG